MNAFLYATDGRQENDVCKMNYQNSELCYD